MKKTIILLLVFLCSFNVFSQNFLNDSNINFNDLLKQYNRNSLSLTTLFDNYLFRALMGDKDLLDYRMDIFSLAQMDNNCLRLLRNMIYARHGLRFSSQDLTGYFSKFSWYNARSGNVDRQLTETDKYNIALLQAFEQRNENQSTINWGNNRVGIWQDYQMVASGYSNRFVIYSNNRMEFYATQMDGLKLLLNLTGTYSIKGNILEFQVNQIQYTIPGNDVEYNGMMGFEWLNAKTNTISLSAPIILQFPVTNITTRNDSAYPIITIGGIDHYRILDNVNAR